MFLVYIFNQATILALLHMRKTMPNAERTFKVKLFFPYVFLIICCLLTVMICFIYPIEAILCLAFILSGLPIFYLCNKAEKPDKIKSRISKSNFFVFFFQIIKNSIFIFLMIDDFTIFVQKLTVSVEGSKDE